ncbi:MAG: response regulator [Nitrospinae bacterium]|nr:response regulator [Nitrospinota bacterium]
MGEVDYVSGGGRTGVIVPFPGKRDKPRGDESLYRSLVHSINEHIYSVRLRGGVVEALFHNPQCETLSGYAPQEHYARPELWCEMIHEDDRERVIAYFSVLGNEGEKGLIEHRIVRKDGSVRWVANSCVVNREGEGVVRLDGFLLDITERKRIEDELVRARERAEAATRLKDNFVAMVAHDLRSPFAGIIGLLQLVVGDRKTPPHPRHVELLNRVLASSQNQLDMINELLNITRLKTGKLTPQRRFIPARLVVETVLQNQMCQAEGKGIRLESDLPGSFSLYADQALIGEVLNNLVCNAIKFTPAGGAIFVTAYDTDPVTITVIDQGVGVPTQFAEHLLRHDVKTTCPGTLGETGTGLGLPYCADIMKAHDGALTFTSSPGKGSAFTLSLPKVRPEALVVDDDELVLDSICHLLERQGYAIRRAQDGDAAIRLVDERLPHLLITDLVMGGMDGYGLIRYLRSAQPLASIPVMVLTCLTHRDQALFDLGVDDFITKPFDPGELVSRVRRFLG